MPNKLKINKYYKLVNSIYKNNRFKMDNIYSIDEEKIE